MKWLMFCAEYPPQNVTGAIRPSRFSKYLSRLGDDVEVITTPYEGHYESLLNGLEKVKIKKVAPLNILGVNDPGVHFSIGAVKKLMLTVKKTQPDVLFVSVPFFFPAIAVFIVSKITNTSYCLDYRDLWFCDPYPYRSKKDMVFRYIGRLVEPLLMKHALCVSFVSNEMMRDQLSFFGISSSEKYFVASTGYDEDEISSVGGDDDYSQKFYGNYISHVGMLDADMNIDDIVFLLSDDRVKHEMLRRNLKFLFVGGKKDIIKNKLEGCDPNFYETWGGVSKDEALKINKYSYGSLVLGSNSRQRLNRKVFEVVNLSKRIFYIGSSKSPTAQFLVDHSSSYIVDGEFERKKLQDTFLEFLKSGPSSARKPGLSYYAKENIVKRYQRHVRSLL